MAGETGSSEVRAGGRPAVRTRAEADQLVLDVLREHAESLLRVARRHSLCADDAQDAYQRGVEIFLRHARGLDAADAHKWIHTVIKHEAMRLRLQRSRSVAGEEHDFDGDAAQRLPSADEQLASFDLLTRSAEALQRLKPQELRALWLKAQGHSYQEIAEINGWTYTKVNRCITEGRRAFLARFADIQSGEECRRWAPVLSRMADGEATAKDLAGVRPHLRHCPACRAELRELGEATRRVAVLLPAPLLAADAAADHGGLLARLHDAIASLHDRLALSAGNLQAGAEAALPGKLAVAAASVAAIGGGVAVQQAATTHPHRVAARAAAAHVAARAADPALAAAARAPEPPHVATPLATAPSARRVSRPAAARRTAKSEFGLSRHSARKASTSTAAREFSQPASSSSGGGATIAASSAPPATAAPAPVPAPAPAPAPQPSSQDAATAAAEFGG